MIASRRLAQILIIAHISILTSQFSTAQTWFVVPDSSFAVYLRGFIPAAMQGDSLNTSSTLVTSSTHSITVASQSINNLNGIQYFTSLTYLDCNDNNLKSLPTLPNTLTYLDCSYNYYLTTIPVLPTALQTLWCQFDSLTTLPALPTKLKSLYCYNNFLTSVPVLPKYLKTFYCYNNSLTALPALDSSLTELYCYSNVISSFPPLNDLLTDLDCHSNAITTFPYLGKKLINLFCSHNALTSLPTIPNTLNNFDCSYNSLTSLPTLPNVLITLTCNNNQLTALPTLYGNLSELYADSNNISCFPKFPNSIQVPYYNICIRQWDYYFNIAGNPYTCVPNHIDAMGDTSSYPICAAGNPNNCAFVAGIEQVKNISNEVTIYPNPTSNNVQVVTLHNNQEALLVTVYDVNGRLVLSQTMSGEATLDVSKLNEGIYHINLSGNNVAASKRLLIVR